MATNQINIGNLDRRINMLEIQFRQCIRSYHDPLEFTTNIDLFIQGIRNYTFAIQANKKSIPNFDNWYAKWQERMKCDTYMVWINKTRIKVVHEDILTTKSNTILTLDADHVKTFITKQYDIMTSSEELIEIAKETAVEHAILRHSTGTIERKYIFDINGEEIEVMHVIQACLVYIKIIYADLNNLISGNNIIDNDLPQLSKSPSFDFEPLKIHFKLKDGVIFHENIIKIKKEDLLKSRALAKERYGEFKLENKLNSKNKLEVARAHFEIARKIFARDGFHMTMLHVHDKNGWSMENPIFRDRAEKIAFWRSFASKITVRKIDELIFTGESWTYHDKEKGIKHIMSGKEIKTLRNKGEILSLYYINSDGIAINLSAIINRVDDNISLSDTKEDTPKPEDIPMFYPVFSEWGLVN